MARITSRPWRREADGALSYANGTAETTARVERDPYGRGWRWSVTQWGRPLADGFNVNRGPAKANADAWIDTAHEATGVDA